MVALHKDDGFCAIYFMLQILGVLALPCHGIFCVSGEHFERRHVVVPIKVDALILLDWLNFIFVHRLVLKILCQRRFNTKFV